MAAIAPYIDRPVLLDEPIAQEVDPGIADPARQAEELEEKNLELARLEEVPDSLRYWIADRAEELAALPDDATLRVDPYLLVALQRSVIASLRALEFADPRDARREIRIRLEQMRQVYRDLAEGWTLYAAEGPKELTQALAAMLDVPQARLAELLGVSPRTFQRWVSTQDSSAPDGEDARRISVLATLANHLRHALTGPGVVRWLERPHPMLDDMAPLQLLDEPDAGPRLAALAASARSHTAA